MFQNATLSFVSKGRPLIFTIQYLSVIKMMIAAGLHPQIAHAPEDERESAGTEEA